MKVVRQISPFRCRMWALHDRLESQVSERTCTAEIQSFEKHGQLLPVLGRPLRADPDYDVELVYGARRLFVARHINKPLTVEVRELSDRECIIAMDIENRQRADISPYERGTSFLNWLRSGHFRSQDDLARALNLSASVVSRLIKVGSLPAVIINAFGDPTAIRESWALSLAQALEEPNVRQGTMQRARNIARADRRPLPHQVYTQLLSDSVEGGKLRPRSHDEVVKDVNGTPLFRIRHQRRSVALLLPIERLSATLIQEIEQAVAAILHRQGTAPTDSAVMSEQDLIKHQSRRMPL